MRDVRHTTFGRNLNLSVEYQEGLIKEAVTAISFGARANVNGWRTQDGDWTNPALVNVLKNTAQRTAFLNSCTIQQFIKEQALLDTYLANGLKSELPEVYYGPLITRNVKPSKSKAVAYMYQKSETHVMDVAYRVLDKHGIKPIARIHDAFVVRNKLSIDLRDEIMHEMRDSTHNSHWSLKPTRLAGFV